MLYRDPRAQFISLRFSSPSQDVLAVNQFRTGHGPHLSGPRPSAHGIDHSSAGEDNNERMEFLGDAVLGFLVSRYLYDIFDGQEGKMTVLRSRLVDQKSLARAATEISLMDHIVLGPSLHEVSEGMLADTLEALIGATYLDGGASSADEVVRRLLLRPELIQAALGQKDHITELKQQCDINGSEPCYEVDEVDLPGSKFRATLMLDGQKVEGFGRSKDAPERT
ncbi:MAG: ribonuclease III domain-containing protein, partial [Methanomassiliicoccales archaeon]